jgi:transcription-repair coupling factor (superfamily II helicase)
LAQNESPSAAGKLAADIVKIPAAQSLVRRLENGGASSFFGVTASVQPFFAALLQKLFPQKTIVVITENLKAQENFQQDLETWLNFSPLFFPAWEIFPHENKLPHADVVSERLQTLVALSVGSKNKKPEIIVASVAALLQKTFAPDDLKNRARELKRGEQIAPLDLIDFLEEQGYEPEAQVSQKGEIALRGGIVDVFPPTSSWPIRLEFFGDELESLREFDPLTQISRGEISEIIIPPAGELGILKSRI